MTSPQTPSPPAPPTQTRTRPWVRIALVASLALNILVIGAVVGAVMIGGPDRRSGDPRLRDVGLGPLGVVMDRDDRRALRNALKEKAPVLRAARSEMREVYVELLATLREEAFDAQALQATLRRQRDLAGRRQTIGQSIVLEKLQGMSVEDRRDLADRIEAALNRRKPR